MKTYEITGDLLAPVTRPNGRLYRPRSLRAFVLEECVLVLGTHDLGFAEHLALGAARRHDVNIIPVAPVRGWWRSSIRNYETYWAYDSACGAAGVTFLMELG